MRWPWVSRERYEILEAELADTQQRQRRAMARLDDVVQRLDEIDARLLVVAG